MVSTWYQLTGYAAVSDVTVSASHYVFQVSTFFDSAAADHGTYFFDKMKRKRV